MNGCIRKTIAVLGLSMPLLAIAVSVAAGQTFQYPERRHGKGELRYLHGVPVLTVAGTPEEIGEQIGVLALKPAARIQDLIRGYAKGSGVPQALTLLTVAGKSLYRQFPDEYRRELEAMADAAGVERDTLILANTIIDLQEIVGCSSLLVGAKRSATGAPLYGRNLDAPPVNGLAELSLVVVYRPVGKQAFVLTSVPGFLIFFSGMNAGGLALGSQSAGPAADGSRRFNAAGAPSAVAGRRLIERCRTVAEAEAWLQKNPLARSVAIAACDLKDQRVIEVTTKTIAARGPAQGICCATNHFRTPELATATTCWRYAALEKSREIERLTVGDVGRLLHSANQGASTIHTIVFEPKPQRIHVSLGVGPSSARPLATLELADLLKGDETGEPSEPRKPTGAPPTR